MDSNLAENYVKLLKNFEWLHNTKMSEFIARETWKKIPIEMHNFFESNFGHDLSDLIDFILRHDSDRLSEKEKFDTPENLREFLRLCRNLTILGEDLPKNSNFSITGNHKPLSNSTLKLDSNGRKGLTAKKVHEIEQLIPFIRRKCKSNDCRILLDIGCGLGYLSSFLCQDFDRIVAIDSENVFCEKASAKNASECESTKKIKFITLKIADTEECLARILAVLDSAASFPDEKANIALIGLHCCGDLQPIILKLFRKILNAKICITVGCCYHKMRFCDKTDSLPNYFPMCRSIEKILKNYPDFELNRFSLRLAAQEPKCRWYRKSSQSLNLHINNVFYRNLLELLNSEGIEFEKRKRRLIRSNHVKNFETFKINVLNRINVAKNGDGLNEEDISINLQRHHDERLKILPYIVDYTALQIAVQGVIESLLVLDRMQYVAECGYRYECLSIFDAQVSPRNTLIYCEKTIIFEN